MTAQSSKEDDAELARLRTAFSANPRSEAFAALADKLCELGQPDEAEQICRKGLVFVPGSLDGRAALARALFMRGRLDEAQALLVEVIDVDADHPEALRRLGQVVLRRGDKARARAILEYAETLLPGDGSVADLLVQAGGVPAFRTQRTPSALRPYPGGRAESPPGRPGREAQSGPGAADLSDDPTIISPTRIDDLMLSQPTTPPPQAVPPPTSTLAQLAEARAAAPPFTARRSSGAGRRNPAHAAPRGAGPAGAERQAVESRVGRVRPGSWACVRAVPLASCGRGRPAAGLTAARAPG